VPSLLEERCRWEQEEEEKETNNNPPAHNTKVPNKCKLPQVKNTTKTTTSDERSNIYTSTMCEEDFPSPTSQRPAPSQLCPPW